MTDTDESEDDLRDEHQRGYLDRKREQEHGPEQLGDEDGPWRDDE